VERGASGAAEAVIERLQRFGDAVIAAF